MRLVAFGASGNCGSHFVRLASMQGHQITAVVRTQPGGAPAQGVTVAMGDVLDPTFVAAVVRGHDAVMSGLGLRYRHPWAKRESADDFTSQATANIVTAMQAGGVERISVISAAGVGDSRRALNWPMRLLLRLSNVGTAYADLERVEEILRSSGLDWQAVRPTTLTHRKPAQRVRITDRYALTASIPREDVAAFILRELEGSRFTERTPIVTAT